MKRFLLFTLFCACVSLVQAKEPTKRDAELTFDVSGHDFGVIARKGGDVSFDFEYTNTGKSPLIITKVVTSCSCTKASFSKRPVVAGEKGVVKITYEPRTQSGTFCKLINVYSNSKGGAKVIYLKGVVEDK